MRDGRRWQTANLLFSLLVLLLQLGKGDLLSTNVSAIATVVCEDFYTTQVYHPYLYDAVSDLLFV